jgi:hypothetical protein
LSEEFLIFVHKQTFWSWLLFLVGQMPGIIRRMRSLTRSRP